jgi:hypothetical protein
MLRLGAQPDRVLARPHQIPHRFIVGGGDVDRGEFTGTMQPGQRIAIAPVGLDPIAAALGHARGIDYHTILALGRQVPVNPEPAGARLVHEAQPPRWSAQRLDDLRQRLQISRDPAVVPDLALAPLLGERDVDRFLVDIHPHEHATFLQGLPPLYVALRVTPIGVA